MVMHLPPIARVERAGVSLAQHYGGKHREN